MSPSRRREAVAMVVARLRLSERRACLITGQHRSTQRHQARSGGGTETQLPDDGASLLTPRKASARGRNRIRRRKRTALRSPSLPFGKRGSRLRQSATAKA